MINTTCALSLSFAIAPVSLIPAISVFHAAQSVVSARFFVRSFAFEFHSSDEKIPQMIGTPLSMYFVKSLIFKGPFH